MRQHELPAKQPFAQLQLLVLSAAAGLCHQQRADMSLLSLRQLTC
jgi:hypothetical protein